VGTAANDSFGRSVSISGNYAIVGALNEDDYDASNSGIAYIYNVTTGALIHTLVNPNAYGTGANDYFGGSVAISGNYAVVGADAEDEASGLSSGKAYIFDVTTGALLHTLDNPTPSSGDYGDQFGFAVGISGDYAIVGALYDDAGGADAGRAYIFDVTTGLLVKTLANPTAVGSSDNDRFGSSVAISGNYCIVTAPTEDFDEAASGTAYIFQAG
jgi:WD40 repeat protein